MKLENDDKKGGRSREVVYTVSQINLEIKSLLSDAFPAIWLEGEISNFKSYSSGHFYFNLKDEYSHIRAVMYQDMIPSLTFTPENGAKVLIFGRVSTYPKNGDYQIIVDRMEETGAGPLYQGFLRLKNKLADEGLFNHARKKPLPTLVHKVGVVTSRDGAVIHDILTVLDDIAPVISVLIYPTRVQGAGSEKEIANAIAYLNKNHKDLDILLVGRGGGSFEDLAAFNTEIVARAIAASDIPIISCVGHETDFTIADFCADVRAATPSVAAENAAHNMIKANFFILDQREILLERMGRIINDALNHLNHLSSSRALTNPGLIYEGKIEYINNLKKKFEDLIKKQTESKEINLEHNLQKLEILSPLSVLERGFSIVKDKDGKILKSVEGLEPNSKVNVQVFYGNFDARVETVHKEE
ncbi:MAG: exodeoxyribonuclease VII large subunit [Elusimicrobiota bacterium]|jgi:exodeoxyribonuclease VII large subunit|nr:exodeoxyribonuclease VII large subunit [Elusimicrobiota bacterium]